MGKPGRRLEEQLPELPSGYNWSMGYAGKIASLIADPDASTPWRLAIAGVTREKHDVFSIARMGRPGTVTIYSEMMLHQEIMTIVAAHRLGI